MRAPTSRPTTRSRRPRASTRSARSGGDAATSTQPRRRTGRHTSSGGTPSRARRLLRLAQGQAAEAVAALGRSLGDDATNPLARARRLPAQVAVSLAVGDVETPERRPPSSRSSPIASASAASGRRCSTARSSSPCPASRAAEEDWAAAEAAARAALAIWNRVGAPYEAAEARIALGMAYEQKGDRKGAHAEYEAAKATFERLGAVLDAQRTMELLGRGGRHPSDLRLHGHRRLDEAAGGARAREVEEAPRPARRRCSATPSGTRAAR